MLALNVLELDPVLPLDFLDLDPVVRRGRFPPGGLAIGMRAPAFLLDAILHAGNDRNALSVPRCSPSTTASPWVVQRASAGLCSPLTQRRHGSAARRQPRAADRLWMATC